MTAYDFETGQPLADLPEPKKKSTLEKLGVSLGKLWGSKVSVELGEGMSELVARQQLKEQIQAQKEITKTKRQEEFAKFKEKAVRVSKKKLGRLKYQLERNRGLRNRQALVPEKRWKRNIRQVSATGQLFTGVRLPGADSPYAKRGGKKGRPKGASGKYYVPGVGPVGVYQYRKYAAMQNRYSRLQGSRAQYTTSDRYPRQYPTYPSQPQLEQYPQQPPMYPQQPRYQQPQEKRPIGNILDAPNIMKGELVGTQDQARSLGYISPDDPMNVENIARPVSNPYGDQYLETDPMTGRPILRSRSREKWLSGERRF